MTHKGIYVRICGAARFIVGGPPNRRTWLKRGVLFASASAVLAVSAFFVTAQRRVSAQSTDTAAADWMTYNGDYAGDRFSSLQEITTSNVNQLQRLCAYDTGETMSFQTGPIAVNGTLYFTTYTGTYAVDGTTCQLKWIHNRPAPATALNVNRGVAFYGGRLFRGTGDAHVIAIDAANGAQIWDIAIGDPLRGETVPLAPIAWNGLVFAGNAGGDDFAVTGRIYALSADDGHIVWRFDTVPDSGPARATWVNATADNPPTGGATWTSYALDTAGQVLYVSTGNVAPDFVEELHPGDNLYTTSIVALDARTGRLLGFVQPIKGDFHDWDIAAAPSLVTTRNGRKFVMAAAKDGFLYGIDRADLAVIYKTAVTLRENVETPLSTTQETRFCPGTQGGVEWNGPAYHPGLNMLFTNGIDWCTTIKLAPVESLKGQVGKPWTGAADPTKPFGRQDPMVNWRGSITAVNADTGEVQWKYPSRTPMVAAVTATGGGLLFTGDLNGTLLAFNAGSGQILWRNETGEPIGGGVVSYGAANGRQRIAVAAAMKSPIWPVDAGSARIIVYGLP